MLLTKDHKENGKLTRAIGVGEWHLFSTGKKRIKRKDRFLLCTDGFYRNLQMDELKNWARKPVWNDAGANRMLKIMLEKKKHLKEGDNISALYFGIGEGRNSL